MGIRGFQKFVNSVAPELFIKLNNLSRLNRNRNRFDSSDSSDSGVTVGVDVSIYIHQFCHGQRGLIKGNYLIKFLEMVNIFKRSNIKPIFVFDGAKPSGKQNTINQRKQVKERKLNQKIEYEKLYIQTGDKKYLQAKKELEGKMVHITGDMYGKLKNMFNIAGIPYIQAKGEADGILAELSKSKIVDYVISDDIDLLVYGTSNLIRSFISKNKIIVKLEQLLERLDITLRQFRQMAILAGCDYLNKILSLEDSYNYIISAENSSEFDLFELECVTPHREKVLEILNMYENTADDFEIIRPELDIFRLKVYLKMNTDSNLYYLNRLISNLPSPSPSSASSDSSSGSWRSPVSPVYQRSWRNSPSDISNENPSRLIMVSEGK